MTIKSNETIEDVIKLTGDIICLNLIKEQIQKLSPKANVSIIIETDYVYETNKKTKQIEFKYIKNKCMKIYDNDRVLHINNFENKYVKFQLNKNNYLIYNEFDIGKYEVVTNE